MYGAAHRACTDALGPGERTAVADIILNGRNPAFTLQRWCRRHPDRGYGGYFRKWIGSAEPAPYGGLFAGGGEILR